MVAAAAGPAAAAAAGKVAGAAPSASVGATTTDAPCGLERLRSETAGDRRLDLKLLAGDFMLLFGGAVDGAELPGLKLLAGDLELPET
jgi:hypothetical protein